MLARGLAAMLLMVGLLFVPLWASVEFVEMHWTSFASRSKPWAVPLLLGFCAGAAGVLATLRLERTRVAEWYGYFVTYFETFQYQESTR